MATLREAAVAVHTHTHEWRMKQKSVCENMARVMKLALRGGVEIAVSMTAGQVVELFTHGEPLAAAL